MNILIPMDFKHYIMGDDTTQHCQKTTEISFEHLCNFLVKKKKKRKKLCPKNRSIKTTICFFPSRDNGKEVLGPDFCTEVSCCDKEGNLSFFFPVNINYCALFLTARNDFLDIKK